VAVLALAACAAIGAAMVLRRRKEAARKAAVLSSKGGEGGGPGDASMAVVVSNSVNPLFDKAQVARAATPAAAAASPGEATAVAAAAAAAAATAATTSVAAGALAESGSTFRPLASRLGAESAPEKSPFAPQQSADGGRLWTVSSRALLPGSSRKEAVAGSTAGSGAGAVLAQQQAQALSTSNPLASSAAGRETTGRAFVWDEAW
jgi:hypothetical protein